MCLCSKSFNYPTWHRCQSRHCVVWTLNVKVRGISPLTDSHCFSLPVSLKTALFSAISCIFINDKQDSVLHVPYQCALTPRITEPHRQNRPSLKWYNGGLCCLAYHWTRTSCLTSCRETSVLVSSGAAPESSCCPRARGDFLLWVGSSRTSAGCQSQLGELLACHALFLSLWTRLTAPVSWFVYLPDDSLGDKDTHPCFLLSALGPATVLL